MPQDFTKKMSMVLAEGLASWQLTNTVAHIGAYIGNKMPERFDTGEFFVSKDGMNLPRNSQFPAIALSANQGKLQELAAFLQKSDLLHIVYVQDMIGTTDDEKLAQTISTKEFKDIEILGIGMFGPNEELKKLTGGLKLWK